MPDNQPRSSAFGIRSLAALAVLVALGLTLSNWLRENAPVGEYIGDSPALNAVLSDSAYPKTENPAANLTIVVFTDYACPACRVADPALRAAAKRDGNIQIIYRDWPIFGARSERAARIALAADNQGIYPALHAGLMRAPALTDADLRSAVEAAGGTWAQTEADLARNADYIDERIARTKRDAMRLGLPGTPGFIIGATLVRGAISEAQFTRAIAAAREERPF